MQKFLCVNLVARRRILADLDYVILRLGPDGKRAILPDPSVDEMLGSIRESHPNAGETLVAKRLERPLRHVHSVDTASLNERQAADARRDPNSLLALNMPLSLIEPIHAGKARSAASRSVSSEAKDAWGVLEVLGSNSADLSGAGVKIAVLDTGIRGEHPAFVGANLTQKNFTSGADQDNHGHGTHCAGTIFGRDVDGKRIGVARGVTDILVGKVLDDNGRGNISAVLEALKWAHSEGANIVSMSLGFDFPALQQRLQDSGNPQKIATSKALKAYRENIALFRTLVDFLLVETADRKGMVIVAASGNESLRDENPDFVIDVSVPAAASPNIVSVGAASRSSAGLHIAPFSNINPKLCAPGVDILSAALDDKLRLDSGTSMACPHVAGVAALWWEWAETVNGRANGETVRAQLLAGCNLNRFVPGLDFVDRGAGMVRAPQKAV
ncbi:S8 family serine peptidase [Mesorhizobium sp. M0016]|uniref:S8 family peptidase n=1 Tax=Mesorhizobium sp. M0016 TaxID=2956843 RepID=UPI0033363A6A